MKQKQRLLLLLCIATFGLVQAGHAQPGEKRIQYPAALKNAFFGVSIGYINYPFTNAQMERGFSAEEIQVPHTAVRMVLYGRQFNKHLAAQVTYMRPVDWVKYRNVNGDGKVHSVWMNVAGLTLSGTLPLSRRFALNGEAGLGIITRKGFSVNNSVAVSSTVFARLLAGGGLKYQLREKWDLHLGVVYSPENKQVKQPHTLFMSAGFHYYLRPLSKERVERNIRSNYFFPKQIIQAGYTTNALGYGVNNAVSKGPVPIFWGGEVHLRQGVSVHYQRNIFHARKVFAFDWGASAGWWQTRQDKADFITLSLYPVLKFMALRSRAMDLFLEYSVAGPTFISRTQMDEKNTGRKFTFQDFMGLGIAAGTRRDISIGIRIAHFSNGNIYPNNDGVKVPLSFSLGYVMK